MSVIQQIRDKYARIAVIAIALSLIGFIMMDAFSGRGGGIFGGNSTLLGKVNGKKIDYVDFSQRVKMQEEQRQQQGYPMDDAGRQQVMDAVWNQEVTKTILDDEIEKLGLGVGKKELDDMLFGAEPPQDIKQGFSDPKTGVYNAFEARQYINNLKKTGTAEQKTQMNDYLTSLEYERLATKYTTLLANSVYFPKWFLEKQNEDNSLIANVSYIGVPYNSISDSSIKISDDEIQAYLKDHKKEYEQKEETRSISYVTFSAMPSAADSATVGTSMQTLKDSFATTPNYENFLQREGSEIPYYDGFISKNNIKNPNKDSILSVPVGVVHGPYVDGPNYVFSKIIAEKQMPDTVKVRHILISTHQQNQSGQMTQVRDDSAAKRIIDSVQRAIGGGASFDTLLLKYSEDPGSKDKGGVYENIPTGQMTATFNDFIFGNPTGTKGVIKTEFGYHYVEILSQKGSSPAYKIVYLAKPIVASSETDATASNQATIFAGDSRDMKSFDANYDKNLKTKGMAKLAANDIKPNDYTITGLGSSREFVKAVFAADQGEVMQPIRVGENYVVAIVTEVTKAGLQSVAKVRATVEPVLRNKKKGEQLKQKIGNVTTLEAVAAATGQTIQKVDSLHFNGDRNPALGYELKVVGAAFNPANKGKVVPEVLVGQAGVYALRVDNIGTTPVQMANIDEQRKMLQMQAQQANQYGSPVLDALRKEADIKDNRAKYY